MSKQIKNGVVVECQKGFVFVCEIKHTLEEKINILESEIWLVCTKSNFKRPDAFNNICVGDMVEFEQATAVKDSGVDLPTAKILLVKKRSNTLVKPTKRSPKDFASNFAKLLILEDLSHLNTGFLCRYLCLAELQGITPLVIGNKLDIGNDQEKILDYLKGVGVDCIKLSNLGGGLSIPLGFRFSLSGGMTKMSYAGDLGNSKSMRGNANSGTACISQKQNAASRLQ